MNVNNAADDPASDMIVTVIDALGDEHELSAVVSPDGSRLVYFDDSPFSPVAARQLAGYLNAAADALAGKGAGGLVPILGGAGQ